MLRTHCDVVLKVIERERREGRGEKWRGDVCAPQARHSPSHDAAAGGASAERAESTKSEVSVGQRSEHCKGGLKEKYRGVWEG